MTKEDDLGDGESEGQISIGSQSLALRSELAQPKLSSRRKMRRNETTAGPGPIFSYS